MCNIHVTFHFIVHVGNPVALLCASKHCSHQNTVHVIVRVKYPAETSFMSLCASEYCLCYCSHYGKPIFDCKNCRCTIHDTVEAIFTVKIVGAIKAVGSIHNHNTINRSPNYKKQFKKEDERKSILSMGKIFCIYSNAQYLII